MTGHPTLRRGGETISVSAPALPRMLLAVAAALAVHVAVLASGEINARATPSVAAAKAMTVRSIAASRPERATEQVARSDEQRLDVAVSKPPEAPLLIAKTEVRPDGGQAAPAKESAVSKPASAPASEIAAATPSPPAQRPAGLPPAPGYLLGATLDPGPQPIGDIEPAYPESANLQEGTVVIRVLVSDTGRVDNVAVVRSEPKGLFEEAALDAFGKAQFTPGRIAGVPVKSQITVEVHFLPINRGARVSGRTY